MSSDILFPFSYSSPFMLSCAYVAASLFGNFRVLISSFIRHYFADIGAETNSMLFFSHSIVMYVYRCYCCCSCSWFCLCCPIFFSVLICFQSHLSRMLAAPFTSPPYNFPRIFFPFISVRTRLHFSLLPMKYACVCKYIFVVQTITWNYIR